MPPVYGQFPRNSESRPNIERRQESSIVQQREIQRLHREIRREELRLRNAARSRRLNQIKKELDESREFIVDSGAARHCVREGLLKQGTNPPKNLKVATVTGLQDVSVVGDLQIAWKAVTGGVVVDILRQVEGIPNCSSSILSMGLLRAQGAYFSINDNSHRKHLCCHIV